MISNPPHLTSPPLAFVTASLQSPPLHPRWGSDRWADADSVEPGEPTNLCCSQHKRRTSGVVKPPDGPWPKNEWKDGCMGRPLPGDKRFHRMSAVKGKVTCSCWVTGVILAAVTVQSPSYLPGPHFSLSPATETKISRPFLHLYRLPLTPCVPSPLQPRQQQLKLLQWSHFHCSTLSINKMPLAHWRQAHVKIKPWILLLLFGCSCCKREKSRLCRVEAQRTRSKSALKQQTDRFSFWDLRQQADKWLMDGLQYVDECENRLRINKLIWMGCKWRRS